MNARVGGLAGPTFIRKPCLSKSSPCCAASSGVNPTPTTSPQIAAFRASSMEMVPRPRGSWPLLVMRLMISRFTRLANSENEMAFAACCTLRAKFRDVPSYANMLLAFSSPPVLPYCSLDGRHFSLFWLTSFAHVECNEKRDLKQQDISPVPL